MKTHHHTRTLAATLAGLYTLSVAMYAVAEQRSLSDAIWWGFMTFTTVGYGDQYPHTALGRFAGIALVSTAVFVVVPVITASVIARFADKTDAWTHDEQEEVKENLREVLRMLKEEELKKV